MKVLPSIRPGTLSLKTVLALYFIPISVLPAIFLSLYATYLFDQNSREALLVRARSERDLIFAELETREQNFFTIVKAFAKRSALASAVRSRRRENIDHELDRIREPAEYRVYGVDGKFITGKVESTPLSELPYLAEEPLRKVKALGETLDRYFVKESQGYVSVSRFLLRDSRETLGVFEARRFVGQSDLVQMKGLRGVDVMVLNRELAPISASFAVPTNFLNQFTPVLLQKNPGRDHPYVTLELGDSRYAGFLYDLPFPSGKVKRWGYLALFVSLAPIEQTAQKLRLALIFITLLLGLTSMLLILVFSNRLVKPIERLVSAMKRVKTGRVEEIPTLDSTYEIEYLVRSFNDMSRNVSAAKRALEIKLSELRQANTEIRDTQSQLVQSAKMISLGQIVAGVAHELNNPIAFIYSNMHHLLDYISRIRSIIEEYRKLPLSAEERKHIDELEKTLDIEFILKDMEDLTKSCVDGANRTKEIVLGLRTFSRMDDATFQPSSLAEGIRSTLKLLAPELKNRVTVHEEYEEIPLVDCSLSQLNQVFMNLLSNAAHAISRKGDVWIRLRREGNYAVVEIEDNGSGMPKEVLDKIFDPFFTTKKVGQGTGLGLSIAYGLIQKHQGTITVQSEVGVGTKFILKIPFHPSLANVAQS